MGRNRRAWKHVELNYPSSVCVCDSLILLLHAVRSHYETAPCLFRLEVHRSRLTELQALTIFSYDGNIIYRIRGARHVWDYIMIID